MNELAMLLMITFCDNSSLVPSYEECNQELIQCKTDDIYTMRECIIEYKEELENEV